MDHNDFYLSQAEPSKSCLLALRSIILEHGDLDETTKYGMPCFTLNNKALCYLWIDKKLDEPYILLVDGNLIDHERLEAGDRARMKILRINSNEDIPIQVVKEVLVSAISLRRNSN